MDDTPPPTPLADPCCRGRFPYLFDVRIHPDLGDDLTAAEHARVFAQLAVLLFVNFSFMGRKHCPTPTAALDAPELTSDSPPGGGTKRDTWKYGSVQIW